MKELPTLREKNAMTLRELQKMRELMLRKMRESHLTLLRQLHLQQPRPLSSHHHREDEDSDLLTSLKLRRDALHCAAESTLAPTMECPRGPVRPLRSAARGTRTPSMQAKEYITILLSPTVGNHGISTISILLVVAETDRVATLSMRTRDSTVSTGSHPLW